MKKTLALLSALLISSVAQADSQADMQTLLKNLSKELPGASAENITTTPIQGLYKVINNGRILYVTPDLKYAVNGSIIDLESRTDITARDQGILSMAEINAIGSEKMVVFPAKDKSSKREITVFTDTSCPFCAKLHNEVPALNEAGITVRYMLYPRAGIGSDAYKVLQSVWCAENQQQAMTDAKAGKTIPEKSCDNPIEEHLALGGKVGLRGTPLVFMDSGIKVSGYRPADALIQSINSTKPLK
ncbi:MAG: DsbC family protein [Candidatus Sedimenticola sp. 6PFRAG5]